MILNISYTAFFDFFQYNTAEFLFFPSISSISIPNYPFWIQFLYPNWIIKILIIK